MLKIYETFLTTPDILCEFYQKHPQIYHLDPTFTIFLYFL